MLRRLVAFLITSSLLIRSTFAETNDRTALVVGNGAYERVARLRNPANDSKAIADTLRRDGFNVIEAEDATRREMIEATRTFAGKLTPGGVGLFYYAGHGIQAKGDNYLVPVDAIVAAEDDLQYEALKLQDVLDKLDDSRVRLSIVILDACRDNPFFHSSRSVTGGWRAVDASRGTLIAYATAPGQTAMDGDGANGIYTTELLKAMSKPGQKLQDIFEEVTEAVARKTGNAQTPWISSSFRGTFYFVEPRATDRVGTDLPPSPNQPLSQSPKDPASAEIIFWQSIADSKSIEDYRAYLQAFPSGLFAPLARARIVSLAGPRPEVAQAPSPTPRGPSPDPAADATRKLISELAGGWEVTMRSSDSIDTLNIFFDGTSLDSLSARIFVLTRASKTDSNSVLIGEPSTISASYDQARKSLKISTKSKAIELLSEDKRKVAANWAKDNLSLTWNGSSLEGKWSDDQGDTRAVTLARCTCQPPATSKQ